MSFETNWTVEDLRLLFYTRFQAVQTNQANLRILLERELGSTPIEQTEQMNAIMEKYFWWVSDLIAVRLKRNQQGVPLMTTEDVMGFIPSLVETIAKEQGEEVSEELRQVFESLMNNMIGSLAKQIDTLVLPNTNPYDQHWRWLAIVFNLAAEQNINPVELLSLDGMTDEITRRQYTKDEFVTLNRETTKHFADQDLLKKAILQPIVEMLSENEEEKEELTAALESEVMPQLNEILEKSKKVINGWIASEVERIYKAA